MASTSSIQGPIMLNDSIYMFPNQPRIPNAEIIFFHDVQFKDCEEFHVQSWTSTENPDVCWPEVWLRPKYPESRIWYVRYDGDMQKTRNGGRMTLFQIAENLRVDIVDIYARNNPPVFLVGHGFSGLIIKKLIQGMTLYDFSSNQSQQEFLGNVKGICYFAPPFMGTKRVDSMIGLRNVGSLVKLLGVLNSDISRLNEWFRQWRNKAGCKAIAIIAGLPTKLNRNSKMAFWPKCISHMLAFWHKPKSTTQLVEEGSARYDVEVSILAKVIILVFASFKVKHVPASKCLLGLLSKEYGRSGLLSILLTELKV